jgi:hypothetical protein
MRYEQILCSAQALTGMEGKSCLRSAISDQLRMGIITTVRLSVKTLLSAYGRVVRTLIRRTSQNR